MGGIRRNLTDEEFNNWTVIRPTTGGKWWCKCKCGYERELATSRLKNGYSRQCRKCYHKSESNQEEFGNYVWLNILNNARRRKKEITVTKEYLYELYLKQDRKCALTGLPIIFAYTVREDDKGLTTASLDRIDNSKGYIPGNVQWVHKHINIMKRNHNQDYFIDLCRKVATHNEK